MNTNRWKKIKEVFQAVIKAPLSNREAVLKELCQEDQELFQEVAKLLKSHDQSDAFMEPSTGCGLLNLRAEEKLLSKRIGNYQLKKIISSGGMGMVYEAIQEKPERTVAIKVMREEILSRSTLRRFEYESQILAKLTHPNIAQVIEAGTYQEDKEKIGLPYFVMEYIQNARPITQYAWEEKLSTSKRVELFLQACDAVHHGHQKGVIHRDLKPSNILVDGAGRIKIIDFGVARATDADIKATTQQTDVGQLLGTLQYMSPEQCKADPDALDIRSDVYSLGVVLYELLCEDLPYHVSRSALFEAARVIRETDPKRPSAVMRALRGDVETILLKTLEKKPNLRYPSIAAFADDLRRHLNGEVILARPAGPFTKTWKLIRRNPVVSAAVGVALISLCVFSMYIYFVSLPQLREKIKLAEVEARKKTQINEFLLEILGAPSPIRMGPDVKVVEVVDQATKRIHDAFKEQPDVKGWLQKTLGWTYSGLGQLNKAEEQFRAAAQLLEKAHGPETEITTEALVALAQCLLNQSKPKEALPILNRVIATYKNYIGQDHELTAYAESLLARAYYQIKEYSKSEELLKRIIPLQTKILGEDNTHTLYSKSLLSGVYGVRGHLDQAITLKREALEGYKKIYGLDNPDTLIIQHKLALMLSKAGENQEAEKLLKEEIKFQNRENLATINAYGALGGVLLDRGLLEESEKHLQKATDLSLKLLGTDEPITLNHLTNLAAAQAQQGKLDLAKDSFQKLYESHRRLYGENHKHTVRDMCNLAMVILRKGEYEKGEKMLRKILTLNPDKPLKVKRELGRAIFRQGRAEEAEKLIQEVFEAYRKTLGPAHPNTLNSMVFLGNILSALNEYEMAEALLKEGLAIAEENLPSPHYTTAYFYGDLGYCLMKTLQYEEAEKYLIKACDLFKKTLGEKNSKTRTVRSNLIKCFKAQGKEEEAKAYQEPKS